MTIAGSDSSGGAGIQADARTFAALGVFAATAITAVTAQNTTGVRGVHTLPPDAVVAQVLAVLDDLPVAAVKTGMLATAGVVEAVAELAADGRLPLLVVDPVLVATSGAALAHPEAVRAYREHLLPHATVVTPNLPEAGALVGSPAGTMDDRRSLARRLGDHTPGLVVVTGGHGHGDRVVDVAWDGHHLHEFDRPRVASGDTHGSGCTFAAAVAAWLAHGETPLAAVSAAGWFVHRAIENARAWRLGAGPGPLDHFGWGASGSHPTAPEGR